MTFENWFHKEYEPADLQIKQYAERNEVLHIPATVYLEDLKEAFEAGMKADVHTDNSKVIAELETQIEKMKCCKNCPENKGGLLCQKEYEGKCLTQKTQYIKDLAQEYWQKGAEYGYNKANEWQFVSEKGLPKESGRYLVYVGGGENGVYPLDFDTEANDFGYWCLDVGANLGVRDTIFETVTERNEDKVIAWKEIVLPKESE